MTIYDNVIPLISNEGLFLNDPNGAKRVYVKVDVITTLQNLGLIKQS